MNLELNTGTFVVSGFHVTGLKTENSSYNIYCKDIALKAGVVFGANSIELTAPSLGQWQLFVVKRNIDKGEWVVTNNGIFAEQLMSSWDKELLLPVELVKLEPGTFVNISKNDNDVWDVKFTSKKINLLPSTTITDLSEAVSTVEEALTMSISSIAQSKRPVMLLLSGGVDSGLLCSFLAAQKADIVVVSIKTPWGDELEGAVATATHVGVPLVTLELTKEDLLTGIESTLRWIQHDNVEIILIQLLITIAYNYASSQGRDLITGMGSDLLNSVSETGMEASSEEQSLADRIISVSGSGLLQTNALGTAGDHLIHHPYWQASTIAAQLVVDETLKSDGAFEKYYLRRLAQRRLPEKIAFGYKTAIHQGANLQQGLSESLSPVTLDEYIKQLWKAILQ